MKPIWRILLVEDNINDADLIRDALIRSNGTEFDITRVETKDELVQALENHYFDFIISDIHMPQLNFEDVVRFINFYNLSDLPLVVVTGSLTSKDAATLLGAHTSYIYVNKQDLWQLGPVLKQSMETEDAQYQIIMAFVQAIEYRDNVTSEHSERVVELTTKLARYLKISERKIREIRTGSLLHDVGKIGVPDNILNKPGMLTDEEFKIMERHCTYGYDMLQSIPSLRKFSEIAYCHHERWNGTGYPRKLSGTDIPLSARIFSIVDVWDALTSDRPYRPAWPKERAMDYITHEREITFDPEVVDAFVKMIKDE